MAHFPRTEPELLNLVDKMSAGLELNPKTFPNPPYITDALKKSKQHYLDAANEVAKLKTELGNAYKEKENYMTEMEDFMKADIRYAVELYGVDGKELSQIGYGPKSARTPLKVPGQTMKFKMNYEGDGSVSGEWEKPEDGGEPAAYRIEMRIRKEGDWILVESVTDTHAFIKGQVRGVELEFRVLAFNKAGAGMASNIVTITL